MIITISGKPGSGKGTAAKAAAEELGMNHFSTGDFFRDIAKEKDVSVLELAEMAEKNRDIDDRIDKWQIDLGEADDNFVIDGRLAFNFIPDSIKIFLDVNVEVAAQRIFSDLRTEEKENTNLEKTKENVIKRMESEKKRFEEYYDVDYTDKRNYDLVIDTTKKTPEEVVKEILDYVKTRI